MTDIDKKEDLKENLVQPSINQDGDDEDDSSVSSKSSARPEDYDHYNAFDMAMYEKDKKKRRERRRSYRKFKTENKGFWMWFNLLIVFFSAGFITGTYMILESAGADCGFLSATLYSVICLHSVNILICLVNLCKCEDKLCTTNGVTCFIIFEFIMLA